MTRTILFSFLLLGSLLASVSLGCGGGGQQSTALKPVITVKVDPPSSAVPAGGTAQFTATVANDETSKGVAWTISCTTAPCGTISPAATASGISSTYTAPASAPAADLGVTVTATSVADTSKSASATVTVPSIVVSVTPTNASVQAGSTLPLTAEAQNDPATRGVTWSITPASGAGTLSDVTPSSVTYNAPSAPPTSHVTVTITATSMADTSKASSATVMIPTVVVSVNPSTPSVQSGDSQVFTGVVHPDPVLQGVTWALSPASGAGTLSNATSSSVTYNAPGPPASLPVGGLGATITATSVADPLGAASATITVPPITVEINPASATVQAAATQAFTAVVHDDLANAGVTWSISPASGAGTLTNVTGTSVTYNAPNSPPTSDLNVALTATPVSDPREAVQIGITVPAITVSVSPASGLIPVNVPQGFNATVANDPSHSGVTWALTGTQAGTACSPGCGTIAPPNSLTTTYTAPSTVPTDAGVTLTATSAADASKSAGSSINVIIGTVKLIPGHLNFGRVKFNKTATLKTTLTNTSSTALTITSIDTTNSGKFVASNNCVGSLAAAGSCDISVIFSPKVPGSFSADLSISDSSAGSPQLVHLSGTGIARDFFETSALQAAARANTTVTAPSPTGPNRVGTRLMDLVDSTRSDPYLANGTKRELLIRFWYPAVLTESCRAADYTAPQVWKYFSQLLGTSLPQIKTNSCLDAPATAGPHPVVVFTHGYTGTFTDYTFLFEDLASRGYVVASVDHTYEATAVAFPDGRLVKSVLGSHLGRKVRTDKEAVSFAVSVRLSDLKFVMNELEDLNGAIQGPFAGKMDLTSVAVAGHSLGGLTALLAVNEEPRFHSAVVLDGVFPDSSFTGTEKPVFVLDAGRELWGDDERQLWTQLRGAKFVLNLRGAEHVTPSDAIWLAKGAIKTGTMGPEKTVTAIRSYIATFLDAHLRGKPLGVLLTRPSLEYPDAEITTEIQSPCCLAMDRSPR